MPKEPATKELPSSRPVAETIVVKTAHINQKHATMIPLTKDQIDAVLKSLKVPVPINKNLKKPGDFQEIVDSMSTNAVQERPKALVCSMETVVCSLDSANNNHKRPPDCSPETDPTKRIRIEFPTPPSDGDSPRNSFCEYASPAIQQPRVKQLSASSNLQQLAVQLPNQSPTILQFPVMGLPQSGSDSSGQPPPESPASSLAQQMQIIQGVPLSSSGVQGQPINFMVPITFSPPLTPRSGSSSPTMFSFPTSTTSCCFSTLDQLQSISMASTKMSSPIPTTTQILLTPTERPPLSSSHLITPTERTVGLSSKFFGYTPGGFLSGSPSVSIMPTVTKEITSSTARKLDLPDIAIVNG